MDDCPKIFHFTFIKLVGFDIWRENLSLWREDKVSFVKKRQNANFNSSKVQFVTLHGHYNVSFVFLVLLMLPGRR